MLWVLSKALLISTHNIWFGGNICCGYSLEVPQRGTSNKYPQHMVSWLCIDLFSLVKEYHKKRDRVLSYCHMISHSSR